MLRRFIRSSKNDPLVDEVQLIDCNQSFATVRYPDGRQSSVSVRDLAPCPPEPTAAMPPAPTEVLQDPLMSPALPEPPQEVLQTPEAHDEASPPESDIAEPRRSSRIPKPPVRYGFED